MNLPDYTRFTIEGFEQLIEIGINPSEIGVKQTITLCASVEVDNHLTHIPDSRQGLQEGYDYNHLYHTIQESCNEPVQLLETLAQRICDRLLSHPKVMLCEVSIKKYRLWPEVASVAITTRRSRGGPTR